jgi:putative FmdB family regulatory protein
MPIYIHKCMACHKEFNVFQKITKLEDKPCPECGKETRRVIKPNLAIKFNGAGFYTNDK